MLKTQRFITSAPPRKARAGHRFGRPDNKLPHGCVFADAYPRGRNGHDRQRQAQCGGYRCNEKYGAVYFAAIGGAGALLSSCIKKAEIIAYEDLGAEALRRLEVENFPVVAVIDSEGNNLTKKGRREYLETVDANGNA